MHGTNYFNTLITVAPDFKGKAAKTPSRSGTVAAMQYALLSDKPYQMTSDELLLAVETARYGVVLAQDYFSVARACLRASPLVKTYGFGLHHDRQARVALVPCESAQYAALLADPTVTKRPSMRTERKPAATSARSAIARPADPAG
jgi:hypothetical protein